MSTCPLHLHSTMYLLNPSKNFVRYCKYSNLHSTMYLLNPLCFTFTISIKTFTFHYVSIKSVILLRMLSGKSNLHSTMYLLNRLLKLLDNHTQSNLHSTMYLLNRLLMRFLLLLQWHLHSTMYLLNQY